MGLKSRSSGAPADATIAETLREEALSADGYASWKRCHALDTRLYTNPQRQALMMPDDLGVFWGANQVGKTVFLVDDAILRLIGRHPLQRHRPPCRVGIGGKSWPQMAATLKALWATVDPRWFRKAIRYEGGQLKGQRYAIYDVVDGPGKGGELCLATNEQGPDVIQGWQVHHWAQDEPLSEAFYGELTPRLFRLHGTLRLGFTPRIGAVGERGEKLGWFWKKVDDGEIGQVTVPLTLDAVTPRGGLLEVPWQSQSDIIKFERTLTGPEREMRMGRSRIPVFTDRFFTCYSDDLIGTSRFREPNWLAVGIDHGSGAGRQRACAVVGVFEPTPEFWVVGEAASDGRTDADKDAADLMAMLHRVTGEKDPRRAIESVNVWIGDRYHAGDYYGGEKSNWLLLCAFCRLLGIAKPSARHQEYVKAVRTLPGTLSKLTTPTKWTGSVFDTGHQLNGLMDKKLMHFNPACTNTLEGIRNWRGREADPEKDACDAWRYASIGLLDSQDALQRAAG
jgi:hypothetical protein